MNEQAQETHRKLMNGEQIMNNAKETAMNPPNLID